MKKIIAKLFTAERYFGISAMICAVAICTNSIIFMLLSGINIIWAYSRIDQSKYDDVDDDDFYNFNLFKYDRPKNKKRD